MIWLVFITGTTVGYGGMVPHTSLGRIIIIVVIVMGTFLMSIIIAAMAVAVESTEDEKKTFKKIRSEIDATTAIVSAMRYYKMYTHRSSAFDKDIG